MSSRTVRNLLRVLGMAGLLAAGAWAGCSSEGVSVGPNRTPDQRRKIQENAFAFLPVHGVRSAIILISGFSAAFVANEIRKGIQQALQTSSERDFVVRVDSQVGATRRDVRDTRFQSRAVHGQVDREGRNARHP